MSSSSPRSLPTLVLPAAMVSFWPGEGEDARARQTALAYASQTGVVALAERRFAILPEKGRESVFDDAITLGRAIVAHLRKIGARDEIAGFLVSPGEVRVVGDRVEVVADELLDDLDARAPRFKSPGIYFTGYAASWLRGRFQFDSAGLYDGPSGRRVPIHRLVGEAPQLGPWHNPEILGRQVKIPRPEVQATLAAAHEGVLQVVGTLGCGKSHAVWHFLLEQEGPKLWFRVGRTLFGTATFARRLVAELHKLAPESLPPGGEELRRPESLTPLRTAELLAAWLDNACKQLGATLWIVCDVVQSAVEEDLDLFANLLARRGAIFRMLLVSRRGGPVVSQLSDLPRVVVPSMTDAELGHLGRQVFAGLSMDSAVERRLLAGSAGHPFALEEGLIDLVHRGLVRRVYGSFFYGGGADVEYHPSRRLVRYVSAEVERLGDPLPLRILAAAEQAVPPEHLENACASFGVELAPAWENAFVAAGWLREEPSAWGPGLAFTCPAYRRALVETVAESSVEDLRQALGKAMVATASPVELNWQTYQLMAGSADALPSLLHLSRKADTPEARQEIFAALESEVRLHRSRHGDAATELELLWKLLPLGHRLGRLEGLERELERALELAVGDANRFAALALVKAEHDQDQGRHYAAVKGLEAALMASEGAPSGRRALIVVQLGKILARQERMAAAKKLFADLLALVDRRGATVLGATCHHHLGEIALFELDLERAAEHHAAGLTVRGAQGAGHERALAASLSAHGEVAFAHGNYPAALDFFRQAEKAIAESSDESELAFVQLGLGRALGALGDAPVATRHLRRALELRQERGDVVAEETARLHLAANQLELGHLDPALKEARRASFRLQLMPRSSVLGDAEQLLGQILFQGRQYGEARERFRDALSIHLRSGRRASAALDSSWLLAIALEQGDRAEILSRSAELEAVVDELRHPQHGELLCYRLFRAFSWLRERGSPARDPIEYLRRAHRELMRKLGFLAPKMRHQFLFNVRRHQELLDAAVEHNLSLPSFQATVAGKPASP